MIIDKKIEKFIKENPDWYVEDHMLVASFEFADFEAVQEKVAEIMKIAQDQDHHPDVTFSYKSIQVKTVTHEAGDVVTEKDFELAKAISLVINEKVA